MKRQDDGETRDGDETEREQTEEFAGNVREKMMLRAKETIGTASKLLRRKIPCAGHFMASRKLWLQRIATPHCDVVMTFPSGAEDCILLWLLTRFRHAGLTVHVRHHASTRSTAFYLTASFPILIRAAEEHHLPKSLKRNRGGGLKEFSLREAHGFDNIDDEQTFFTSQERQWLILRVLQSIRADCSDVLQGLNVAEGQPIVPKCLMLGVISQVFPLHDGKTLEKLQISWVQNVFNTQPLDNICNYFGVKISMYFAWLGHYTAALTVPAAVGFIFWLCSSSHHASLQDIMYVLFSIFNVIWATVYLQAWRRYSAELAFRWGTLDQRDDLLAEPRPLFSGPLQRSSVTGRLEPVHPLWKQYVCCYLFSIPIIMFCLSVVFVVMIASFHIQNWWDVGIEARGLPMFLSYIPKVMLAVVITVLDGLYYKVAVWLNDKENYRLETSYENHLIGKVALFQFVNSFLSLFYIAFYLQDQERLKEQLAALLISRQVIGNLKESALPYVFEQMRLAKLSFDLWGALSPTGRKDFPGEQTDNEKPEQTAETETKFLLETPPNLIGNKRNISQAELESSLFKYTGTFDDHLEMVIQLGYVVLFSAAFPPAALCALVNNFIEIRTDAFKLTYICQRPFGQRVANIGSWHTAMEYMSLAAVFVNCALIGLSGQVHRMFPDMTATQTILLIVALEHIMLFIRFLIRYSIPEMPHWLATEMAKLEWARREAQRLNVTATPSPEAKEQKDKPAHMIGRFHISPIHKQQNVEITPEELSIISDCRKSSATHSTDTDKSPARTPLTPSTPVGKKVLMAEIPKIPPFKPRKSADWPTQTDENEAHQLTVGSHGVGSEWTRRFKANNQLIHRSTDCLTANAKDASSSDSDLLRKNGVENPMWPPSPRPVPPKTSGVKPRTVEPTLTESNKTIASDEGEEQRPLTKEELAEKKSRVKQSLMKRARSVAIFSLKLKERRARESQAKASTSSTPATTPLPPPSYGGELSCIPIEKLIQLDDVVKRKPNDS